MSQHRIRSSYQIDREIRAANGGEYPKGPNGRRLCRICSTEVSGRRQTLCSEECTHKMMMLCDPGYVRGKLYERDHGICTRCGIDCQAVRAAVRDMWDRVECQAERQKWIGGILRTTVAFFAEHNLERHRTMWEAHHKIAVVEGGGECGLDNYETLCVWCHKRETRELARRRSELRRGQFALDE